MSKPIPNSPKKIETAITLYKYDYEKHVFLQLGTAKNTIPLDLYATATNLLKKDKDINLTNLKNSFLKLDISKKEIR